MEFRKLGELVEVYDSLHKTPKEYTNEGYPMVRVKDIDKGFLNLNGTSKVSKEVYEEFSKKYKPKKGDIIFSRVGSYGIPCYVNIEESFCLGQNTVLLHSVSISSVFLYYCLNSPFVQNQIHKFATGSTQKTISLKSIKELEIPFPSIKSQERIGKMLFDIDSKIEMNNNIISKLDEISSNVFQRWFIDFEFPNEQGLPYRSSVGEMVESELGEIPKGWRASKIGNEVNIKRGASPRPINEFMSSTGRPWVKITDANASISCYLQETKEFIIPEGIAKSRTVEPGTLILSNSATPGIPRFMDILASVHDGWLIFSDYQSVSKEYLYLYLLNQREQILSLSNGSVFRNLKTDILKSYKLVVPTNQILDAFQKIISPLFNEIRELSREIKRLETLRDTLLPKLLSGEIEIPDKGVVEPS